MAEKYSDQIRRETRDSEKPGHGRIWSAYCARVADNVAIFEDKLEMVEKELNDRADLYEKDGQPGPLGYNLWGWRTIAEEIRKILTSIQESK